MKGSHDRVSIHNLPIDLKSILYQSIQLRVDRKPHEAINAFLFRLMRLLTHNTLKCAAKEVKTGYPLQIEIVNMEVRESTFNPEFINHILPSMEWSAILVAAEAVGMPGLPVELDPEYLNDNSFLEAMHHLLLDIHILEGFLICPETDRRFPIKNGIPNMNLPERDV